MKTKKLLSVVIAIALIWVIFSLSGKFESDAYSVFIYIADILIILALIAYQIGLRISTINSLTQKIDPAKCLKTYSELDGTKYTDDRYIYEALAKILLGDYASANELLKKVSNKKQYSIKAEALNILCHHFNSDSARLKESTTALKNYCSAAKDKKNDYYMNFSLFMESLNFDEKPDTKITENYADNLQKKTFVEAYVASFLIGEMKYKCEEFEKATELFEHVVKNCPSTILAEKADAYLKQIKN